MQKADADKMGDIPTSINGGKAGMLNCWRLGVTTFLFRGFAPLADAIDYGAQLPPCLRAVVLRGGAYVIVKTSPVSAARLIFVACPVEVCISH